MSSIARPRKAPAAAVGGASGSARVKAYFFSDSRRSIQTVLGLIWLLVGGLQFQSFMYGKGFIQMLSDTLKITTRLDRLRRSVLHLVTLIHGSREKSAFRPRASEVSGPAAVAGRGLPAGQSRCRLLLSAWSSRRIGVTGDTFLPVTLLLSAGDHTPAKLGLLQRNRDSRASRARNHPRDPHPHTDKHRRHAATGHAGQPD